MSIALPFQPVPSQTRVRLCNWHSAVLLLALAVTAAPWCSAQEKGVVAPTSPNLPQGSTVAADSTASSLIGSWGISRSDKESGDTEITVILFKADGSYATQVRSNLFPDQAKQRLASGRYAVTDAGKGGFTLTLDRAPGDPEEDKASARSTLRIAVVDADTLRAADGSLVKRIK